MEVICIGLLIADIFSSPLDELPREGELKLTDRFLLSVGGCAANTSACLKRLGRTATVVGKVGADDFGDFVIRDLNRLGIDASHVKRGGTHPTSQTFILNVKGQDRRYLHYTGSNADFSMADVDRSILDSGRVVYVGGYLGLPGLDSGELAAFLRQAKQKSLITVLDIIAPAGLTDLMKQVEPLLPYVDYFLPNEDEARLLTGAEDPRAQGECLSRFHPEGAVVITRGSQGALLVRNGSAAEISSYRMETVDGSGAGDAFAAGLITGLLEEWPVDRALKMASAVGASCTRALGCTAGVFNLAEALAFIQDAEMKQAAAGDATEEKTVAGAAFR